MPEDKRKFHSTKSGHENSDYVDVSGGMAHKSIDQAEFQHRKQAIQEVTWALKTGVLIRPETCSKCGRRPDDNRKIMAYHASYDSDKWLDVIWLCPACWDPC